jgi:hypothetical protein
LTFAKIDKHHKTKDYPPSTLPQANSPLGR